MTLAYLIAGEASGDVLGARLMDALRLRRPEIEFAGIGGARMAERGFVSAFPMRELSVMGLAEVLPRLLPLRRRLLATVEDIRARKPDVVVTIDSPGFTLRVLKRLRDSGLKRAHYVAPQVWAWHESRAKKFPGLWDTLLCLLPFEPDFFAAHGVPARFVGHPVLDSGADAGDAARFFARSGLGADAVPLILMPGSRVTETARLLPVFRETAIRIAREEPNLAAIVAAAPDIADAVAAQVADWPVRTLIVREVAERYDAFAAARAALTKSGTSTLELALAGVPMAVTYRINPISAAIARRVITVKHVAMINLLAGEALVPELLQDACNPAVLAKAMLDLLREPARAAAQKAGFGAALASLRAEEGTPSEAAAKAVEALLF